MYSFSGSPKKPLPSKIHRSQALSECLLQGSERGQLALWVYRAALEIQPWEKNFLIYVQSFPGCLATIISLLWNLDNFSHSPPTFL
jgi:hypothetical protein